ncbi:MAG: DUF6713 family protein [Cyclobacteriaceae bacterium]
MKLNVKTENKNMTHNLFFLLALTFILLHEMDAVRCKEWRIFPGLSLLNDSSPQSLPLRGLWRKRAI